MTASSGVQLRKPPSPPSPVCRVPPTQSRQLTSPFQSKGVMFTRRNAPSKASGRPRSKGKDSERSRPSTGSSAKSNKSRDERRQAQGMGDIAFHVKVSPINFHNNNPTRASLLALLNSISEPHLLDLALSAPSLIVQSGNS